MEDVRESVSAILAEWGAGDASARERLVPIVYEELRRLAGGFMRRERAGHSLQPTDLVHEALLRLLDQRKAPARGRRQLMALVAQLMRRVLVDHARRKRAQRRNAGRSLITLKESLGGSGPAFDVLELHLALSKLAELDERQARVVELRTFGGCDVAEVAELLDVSAATIKREWRTARVWLARELGG